MRQSPRLLQGNRAGRNGPEPITGSSSLPPPQPRTPQHPKTGAALDELILSLEREWRLGLEIRDKLWSPQKADKESTSDKVYGQIKRLFYSARPALDSALAIFKSTAPGFAPEDRLKVLHGILKSVTQSPISRAGTPLNEPPKSLKSESLYRLCKSRFRYTARHHPSTHTCLPLAPFLPSLNCSVLGRPRSPRKTSLIFGYYCG